MSSLTIDAETDPDSIAEVTGNSAAQDIGPTTGSLSITDLDIGDTLTASVTGNAVAAYNGGALPAGVDVSALAASGAISFGDLATTDGGQQTIDWTYDPAAANLDWLGQDQTLTLTYTAEVSDGQGGTVQHDLVVTITGTNDAPTIDAETDPDAIAEVTGNSATQDIGPTTGSLSITDLDIGDTLTASVTGNAVAAYNGGALPAGVDVSALAASGAISFGDLATTDGGQQTIDWTYDPAAANLDWLGQDQTLTLTYTAEVSDGQGGTVQHDLVVTITGTNDTPTIDAETDPDSIAEVTGNSAAQDIGPTTGSLSITDLDIGDTLTASVTGNAVAAYNGGALPAGVDVSALAVSGAISFGDLATTDGGQQTIDWTYDPAAANLDWLGQDQTLTLTYTAEVSDGQGGTVQHDLVVTITGTNDAPTIDAETDPDSIAEVTGNSAAQDIGPTTGSLSITDLDIGDTLTASVTGNAVAAYNGGALPAGVDVSALAASGAISFGDLATTDGGQQTIDWTYDPAAANLDWLGQDQTLTLTYTAEVSDGQGGTVQHDLVVTITGTNDAPTIDAETDPDAIAEVTGNSATQDIGPTTGSLSITDLDIGDTLTASVTGNAVAAYNGGALPAGVDVSALAASGAISFGDLATTDGGQQTIDWTYDPAAANLDWLGQDQTLTLTYTAEVSDGQGGTVQHDLVVTITGTNDTPTITTGPQLDGFTEVADLAVGENTTDHSTGGTISFADVDLSDRPTATVDSQTVVYKDSGGSVQTLPLDGTTEAAFKAAFGIVAEDGNLNNGAYDWTYSIPDSALDFLGKDETVTVTSTVLIDDGNGGTVTQDVVVTLTGTNDAPVIAGGPVIVGPLPSLTEAANHTGYNLPALAASGDLSFSDVDLSDIHVSSYVEVTPVWSGAGAHTIPAATLATLADPATLLTSVSNDSTGDGAGTVHWEFNLPDHFADFLAVGETLTVAYDVTIDDHKGGTDTQRVTLVITGKNDIPVANADVVNTSEDGTSVIIAKVLTGGVLANDTDADLNDHLVVSAVAAGATGDLVAGASNVGHAIVGTYGTLTLNAGGSYSYAFLNTDAIIATETKSDVFHYQVTDLSGAVSDTTLTINIAGTDLNVVMTPPPANPHDADPFFAQRGNDIVHGTSDANVIHGADGNDQLFGLGGGDTLYGENGNDRLSGGDGADTLSGGAGTDVVQGDAGNDTLLAGVGDGAGYDIYDGGADTDTLDYSTTLLGVVVDLTPLDRSLQAIVGPDAPPTIGALLGAGGYYAPSQLVGRADGAEIATDAILNVENVLGGAGNDTITGDGNANLLRGGAGNDVLHGAGGADTLSGDAGNDLVDGGAGNDTILAGVNVGAGYDVYDGGADNDTVDYSTTTLGVTVALTAINRSAEAVTNPDGAGPNPDTIGAMLAGEGLSAATLVGRADGAEIATDALMNIENVIGGSGNDTITGDGAANIIQGNGGVDQIWGGGGDDTIYGGDGNDILVGGNGSTTIPSGNDTIFGGAGNDQLFGEDGNDILWGGAGSDQYAGGAGNDTLYFEGDGAPDTAWGGADSDTFVFQQGFGVDTIKDFLAVGTSADKIDLRDYGTTSFAALTIAQVGNNVEITGLGAGNKIILEVVNAGALTSNNFLMAVSSPINGNSANNTLTGTAGNDTINGLGGNDTLAGLAGADTLDGGTGTDTATYAASPSGVNVSLMTGTGTGGDAEGDKLLNIENLTGSNADDTLEGNAGANVLVGGANGVGGDTVSYAHAGSGVTVSLAVTTAQNTGGAGSDTLSGFENLTGSAFDDTLTGSTGNNVLTGLAGNDTLNGGAGADTMIGGFGNDTYVVDNPGDIVDEGTGTGTDLVQSSITFSLSDAVHAKGMIENLTLTGSGAISATGTDFDNVLTGNSGANTLTGLGGNDTLNGGTGADTMIGGTGNDTYVVDNAGDIVDESGGSLTDIDTVQSSITFSLADIVHAKGSVENLTLTGSSAINATGNELDNVISGNAGNNVLSGGGNTLVGDTVSYANAASAVTVSLAISAAQNTIGAGTDTLSGFENLTGSAFADHLIGSAGDNVITGGAGLDTLTGGGGSDAFVFAFSNLGLDTITDFVSGTDYLQISAAGFGHGLVANGAVTLVAVDSISGGYVGGADGYFLFDNATTDAGTIYWDATGGSSADAVAIAKITGTTLSASDFHIV